MLLQEATARAGDEAGQGPGWFEHFVTKDRFHNLSLLDLLVFLGVMLLAWGVSRFLQAAVLRARKRRGHDDPGGDLVIRRLMNYLIMTLATFVALDLAGVQLNSLFATGAVFAVVVGFALQNLSQNFVSGVILMIERSITPGDVLEVEGRVVRVVRMGIRATVARTRDDEDIIIPNSMLVTSTVKNFTLRDSLFRLRCSVGVSYESDVGQVFDVIQRAAEGVPWREQAKPPLVLLTGFGASSVNFEVSVWIENPWHQHRRGSDLNRAIWDALHAAKITIAYPQLDLHFDKAGLAALGGR